MRPIVAVVALSGCLLASAQAAGGAQSSPPRIDARAAIVIEPATQTIVYARRPNERRQIASTTKMMTALVVLDRASLDDVMVTVPYNALAVESVAGFRAGERVTVRDLLRALMAASANDAAKTLAVRTAGSVSEFVQLMNRKARSLGLDDTSFDNPIGLDGARNYSTASDLVRLAYVVRQDRFLRGLVDSRVVRLTSGDRPRSFVNRNRLLGVSQEVNGVKTGHTAQAGYLLVGSASRRGVTVLSAVLGEPSEQARDRDSLALLRFGLGRFKVVTAVREGDRLTAVPLAFRGDETVDAVAAKTIRRTVTNPESLRVGVTGVPAELDGPLRQGTRIGTVVVFDGDRIVSRAPLVTAGAVDAASFLDRLRTWLMRPLTIGLLLIFLTSSVYLLRVRKRAESRRRQRISERRQSEP